MRLKPVKNYLRFGAGNLFTVSLIVIGLTICGVYYWGLGVHHTFFENSILATTILSIVFFLFITTGLFFGLQLKDDFGVLRNKIRQIDLSEVPNISPSDGIDLDLGDDGCVSVIVGILVWIVVAFFLSIFLWLFAQVIWMALLAFTAMLYWIFFRALRLVFKNSNKCKGELPLSIGLGLYYTFLYNFWIYGIFIVLEFLKNN